MSENKPNHYVNNKEFLNAMIDYKNKVREAENQDEEHPRVPNYIGEQIVKISRNLATKSNFSNYPFKEEMISDGIENAIKYIDNFNPDKSSNPFGYFSRVIYWAFVRRIKKEKKHLYTKFKASEHATVMHLTSDTQMQDSGTNYDDGIKRNEHTEEYVQNFIRDFEKNDK